jgi:hypothetical protein
MPIIPLRSLRLVAVAGAAVFVAGADQTSLGPTVGNVLITKYIPGGNLSLSNKASLKTVQAVDLRVSGNEPVYDVTGQLFCKNGARLVEAQAIVGNVFLHGPDAMAMAPYGKSAKVTSIAGRSDANVNIPVNLTVARRDTGAAVDLQFNPARHFMQKVKSFAANGGSAATYLREDQAFEMPVTVNLVAWCKMPVNANSVLAGKTYAGFASRSVPVSILYSGDAKIVDGRGVRATAGQTVKAQEEATPQVKAKEAQPPARRPD